MARKPFVAGNWKMNCSAEQAKSLTAAVAEAANAHGGVDVLVAPPFPYLSAAKDAAGGRCQISAQNCYFEESGAFTGEVSVGMLKDVGCDAVILGHSERRHVLGETDEVVNKKTRAALDAGLPVILCVGELLQEREAGKTTDVLDTQMAEGLKDVASLDHVVIAYEPVWAIGTGKTASPEQAEEAHAHLRGWVASHYDDAAAESVRILYGGSVKPDNAAELIGQANVDGALVGGASLKADLFVPIIEAAASVAA